MRPTLSRLTLTASAGLALLAPLAAAAAEPANLIALAAKSPAPPWPAGDERGMANTLGEATTLRCGWHLSQRGARTYEASFERSNAMPKSPFANPSQSKPKPTAGVPFSAHAFNAEAFEAGAEPQQQGTQIDALGTSPPSPRRGTRRPPSPRTARATTAGSGSRTSSRHRSRRCSGSASRRCRRW
jgi:hypothetical protein